MNIYEQMRSASRFLAEKLVNDGYEVIVEPRNFSVGSYRPDIVASKGGRDIFVEIKAKRTKAIERQLESIKKSVEERPNTEFRIYYLDELNFPRGPKTQTNEEVSKALKQIETLIENDLSLNAAFLLSWAAFEAAARRVFESEFERPQSPGRVVTVLTQEGLLSQNDSSQLLRLIKLRNTLVHGELSASVNKQDIEEMLGHIRQIQNFTSEPDFG